VPSTVAHLYLLSSPFRALGPVLPPRTACGVSPESDDTPHDDALTQHFGMVCHSDLYRTLQTASQSTIDITGDSTSSHSELARISAIRIDALPSPNGFGTVTMRS